MPMVARFDAAGLMFFYAGDLRLALQQVEKVEAVSSVIYFRVDDIEAAVNDLKSHSVKVERDAELVFPDDGLVKPLSLRTNCRADARISSSVAGGSKLNSVLMFLHMQVSWKRFVSASSRS